LLILVDAMGGDNAPKAIVNGCIDAINEKEGFDILLIGDSQQINSIISERGFSNPRLKVHHASEIIKGEDSPVKSIIKKKDSSMAIGFNLLKEKKGDVFVSAGNSGALMAGSHLILGGLKGVDRPALGAIIPTKTSRTLIIDAGLNTVCKPINYLQFAIMGSIYMKELFNIDRPKVGLLNVGSEQAKGNETTKQAYALLSESNVNFIGNIEGNDIMLGNVDVVVCDGFTGNVLLKFLEGTASFVKSLLKELFTKNLMSKISALIIGGSMKKILKSKLDSDENGGAPILGINGLVFKSHGNSEAKTIKSVVIKAYNLAQTSVQDKIIESFANSEIQEVDNGE